MTLTRRSALRAGAAGIGAAGFAGCLSDVEGFDGEGGYAAFFAIHDWSQQVAGDELSFENPVEVGTSGHGWSPSGNLARDVASSRIFIYLDSAEFPWAQDVAETIERDYEGEIHVVDVLEGIEVLSWAHGDGDADHDDGDDDAGHEHDGNFDPHVWLDPVRVQEMVTTIADGLAQVDPDNADTYESNAEAYADRVADVDAQFEELVADADLDVAVLAGHNSFQYLEDRYGVEFHAPTGVSPDEEATQSAIAETVEVIDDRGIETILYDVFDAPGDGVPPLAASIIEDSDASEARPLAPVSGTTAEWQDRGWGWVEQMTDVNRSSLGVALGAE